MKIHSEAITPAPPGLTITDTTLPSGMVNQAYSHTMAAVGGTPPYTWSAMGLPTSLSIDTDTGGITGTPIAGDEGDHAVSITVQDDASGEYTKGYTLTINPEASNVMGDWRFDEGGGTTATDSSGWDNHGTIYGASYVSGHSNTALSFDGSNDYVAIPDDPSLDVTGDLSIEFWMRCDGIGNSYQALVSKRSSSDYTAPYYLGLDNRAAVGRTMAISFGLGSGTSWAHIVANNAITVGEWAYVVATVSGTTMRIYIDGVEMASGTFSGTRQANSAPVKMGVYPGANTYYFDGLLDEVKIHSRALDASEFNLLPGASTKPASSVARLGPSKIIAMPNPVRGDRVTFEAAAFGGKTVGEAAKPIKLEIYDLAGRKVFDTDWLDTSAFEWFLQNNKGETLANGVYIYVVYTMDENGNVRVESKEKLFILR